jgi:hypothetical protein
MATERSVTIESDGLRLEGALREGKGEFAALVLHPHPQYGGDMHNHVVMAVCAALAALGASTLRFNFRGAGRSEGSYDSGRGESSDARAAAAFLREHSPAAALLLVGYSFGAMIAAMVADQVKPDALVLVSPAVAMMALPRFDPSMRTLVVAGDRDQVAPVSSIRALEAPNRTIVVAQGVDHGWWPGIDALVDAITAFVAVPLSPPAPSP